MSEPKRGFPWGSVVLALPLVLLMIGLLAIVGGLNGAIVGLVAAVLVFSFLLLIIWRARLLGGGKSVPVTPALVAALFVGMIVVLVLAVLVFVLD